jgi:hypothetical protein
MEMASYSLSDAEMLRISALNKAFWGVLTMANQHHEQWTACYQSEASQLASTPA